MEAMACNLDLAGGAEAPSVRGGEVHVHTPYICTEAKDAFSAAVFSDSSHLRRRCIYIGCGILEGFLASLENVASFATLSENRAYTHLVER